MFMLSMTIALILIDSWRGWDARNAQLREAEVATANMARAIAQHAEDTVKAADVAILGIEQQLNQDGWSEEALQRLRMVLEQRVKQVEQINGLFVLNRKGERVVHSLPFTPANANNSDRAYFIYHRDHPDPNAHLGPPIRARSSGEWVFTISRRLNDEQGDFAGVILATISLDYFQKFYDRFNIGKNGSIVLALNSAIMITRRPLRLDSIAKDMHDTTIFKQSQLHQHGTFIFSSAQDGVERIHSFERLNTYPLFVGAALSVDEVLANWRKDYVTRLAVLIFLITLIVLFGFYLIHELRRRLQAEQRDKLNHQKLLELNQTLERLSMQDGLTELANRRSFDLQLQSEMLRARREKTPLALLMIDLDHFKKFNDNYGHLAGDECLRRVATAIKTNLKRAGDLAARYGGEELAVILPATDFDGAWSIAEQLRQAILNLRIAHQANQPGLVSVSIGVHALIPGEATTADYLIEQTDRALYRAKEQGRNRCAGSRT